MSRAHYCEGYLDGSNNKEPRTFENPSYQEAYDRGYYQAMEDLEHDRKVLQP